PSVVRADAAYDKHGFSKPFSGGAIDRFVEIYERHLVRHRAIPAALARRSRSAVAMALAGLARDAVHRRFRRLRRAFAEHFVGAEETFRQALCEARDDFARLVGRTWDRTSVRDFPGRGPAYAGVVTNMLAADRAVTGGRYGEIIRKAFRQRGIVPSGRRARRRACSSPGPEPARAKICSEASEPATPRWRSWAVTTIGSPSRARRRTRNTWCRPRRTAITRGPSGGSSGGRRSTCSSLRRMPISCASPACSLFSDAACSCRGR